VLLVKQRSAFEEKDYAGPGSFGRSGAIHVDTHQAGFRAIGPGRLAELGQRFRERLAGL
jgi:hypothetical protein